MSALENQWIPIFRAGDYGKKGKYTEQDLDQVVANYQPVEFEAPAVVGHPVNNAPAHGWVERLKRVGDTLYSKFRQINPKFEDAVEAGRFKKRSVAFYRTDKGLHLRHVGWLGAMDPQVTGLADAVFSGGEFEEVEFSSHEETPVKENKKPFSERVRDVLVEAGLIKPATQHQFSADDLSAKLAEQKTAFDAELKKRDEAHTALATQFSAQQTAVATAESGARVATLVAGLKTSKAWLPAYDKMGVAELFSALSGRESISIEFSANGKTEKKDAVDLLADVLTGIGKIVPEGTLFSAAKREGGEPEKAEKVNAGGMEVDRASVVFSREASKRASKKKITFNDAYRELHAEGFKPVVDTATAGAV